MTSGSSKHQNAGPPTTMATTNLTSKPVPQSYSQAIVPTTQLMSLKRVLGIPRASSMVTGTMIGSGIFISARWVLVYSGSVGLAFFVWLLCALVSFIGGLCWVELGLTFPKCGGEYILIKHTLGSVPAFALIWLKTLITTPCSRAISLLTFASYVLGPFFPGCTDRVDLVLLLKIIAVWSLCTLCLLNCLSANWATRVQIVFTAGKFLALMLLIGTGFYSLAQGHTSSFKDSFKDTTTHVGMVGLAFQSGLWAYEGWDNLNDVIEEVKNPKRNMPWSVLGSVFLVTCCYFLVNLGYLAVLTPQELKESPATAVAVVQRVYGFQVAWIVPVLVACSIFGSSNGSYFSLHRVTLSAAREGHLPAVLAMIHTNKRTPIPALLLSTITACLFLIPKTSTVQNLMKVFSAATWLTHILTLIGLLWTRYKRPDLPRPFK
ncbi:Y+L amino acid transporter 2-like, partial [Actinia tenebrosa]|uniref:Y+L amino acid transporter 2-like n=1 Tax=Actinia tenebrosa TaxID=6105 RepID=A0A6P8HD10_ACTTE